MQPRPITRAGRLALLGAVAAAALGLTGTAHAATVYENDFSTAAGPAFSDQRLATATRAAGDDRFSGEFGADETQTLTVGNLPSHTKVTVSYDLLILGSWDGNAGPDTFYQTTAEPGAEPPSGLFATFSNVASSPQSYPGPYGTSNPRFTGAAEHGTLLDHPSGNAVYRITTTVRHTADTAVIGFQAFGLSPDAEEESWGIDDVVVQATDPDADGDGVPDADDGCPDAAGTVRGCPVPAQPTTEVVRDADVAAPSPTDPFPAGFHYGRAATSGTTPTFEFGPAQPPAGKGSYRIGTPTDGATAQIASDRAAGDRLRSLTNLSYAAFIRDPGYDVYRIPELHIAIDANGPAQAGGLTTLVYEYAYGSDGHLPAYVDAWFGRDAVRDGDARYWSTQPIADQAAGAGDGDNVRTLKQIVASNPNATIRSIALSQGPGTAGTDAWVDALRIQSGGKDVIADLEPDNSFESHATGRAAPVFTSQDLSVGERYAVTITGTARAYARTLMDRTTRGWTLCGTAEAEPLFPTPGLRNGPTGFDAEYVYAFPQPGAKCNPRNAPLPRRQSSLRFSQGGRAFTTPTPSAPLTGMSAAHTYTYEVRGDGGPLKVKLQDSNYTDNAGRFRVEVDQIQGPIN